MRRPRFTSIAEAYVARVASAWFTQPELPEPGRHALNGLAALFGLAVTFVAVWLAACFIGWRWTGPFETSFLRLAFVALWFYWARCWWRDPCFKKGDPLP